MPGSLIRNKAQRLSWLATLLYTHSQGRTTKELARDCGVTQRTIQRDLQDLQAEPMRVPLIEDDHRWKIMPGTPYNLAPVQFDLREATAIFLGARLLSRYADESVPCINAGLQKLAAILPPPISEHVYRTVETMRYKPAAPSFDAVFAVITLGWALRRKVRIWYRSASSDNVHDYALCPYFIEPSCVGYATYVIGHASYFERIVTFKVERISQADLLDESFDLPIGFDGPTLLQSAWGVMYGQELQTVVLRFAPAVSRRVRECIWHPSQETVEEADGGCRLTVRVALPLEMKSWIRGWGPECEVLEPAALRAEVAEEMRQAAKRYGE